MNYDWFKIFNLQEFMDTELVSRTVNAFLSGYEQKEISITRGDLISLVVDDVILPVKFLNENPYHRDGYAVYEDEAGDVYLGIEVPE